ncbi:hypothetical protein [Aquabacterium sp.]|uniref:hypothetical protein n=1 Tax=Aquabacterium sp. TaxID=1872578 RepID=UPI003D6CF3FC
MKRLQYPFAIFGIEMLLCQIPLRGLSGGTVVFGFYQALPVAFLDLRSQQGGSQSANRSSRVAEGFQPAITQQTWE